MCQYDFFCIFQLVAQFGKIQSRQSLQAKAAFVRMAHDKFESGTDVVSKDEIEVELPKLFRVILLNDDYTTMDFVVSILETTFKKSPPEAVQIMLNVHHKGQGVCGTYPKQIAEAKIGVVHDRARKEGFPLRCTMEEA